MNDVHFKAGFVFDSACKRHLTGVGHPEQPARLDAVHEALASPGLLQKCQVLKPRSCTDDEILYCHTAEYLQSVKEDIQNRARQLRTGDTVVSRESLTIARLSAGGVLAAVDQVMGPKPPRRVFCALRPPGHHATPDRGMGFCLFNSIAMAARYAQKKYGVGKVLIVDWDVHHGNGTQDIFYKDGSVFFFSTHQSPWYPGTGDVGETGSGEGRGTVLNQPFAAGAGRREIWGAFCDRLLPAAAQFKPELLLISAGFDSRIDDPLGGFVLEDEDFAELTQLLLDVARDHCEGRVVSVLEGGYNLQGLGLAARAHFETLLG